MRTCEKCNRSILTCTCHYTEYQEWGIMAGVMICMLFMLLLAIIVYELFKWI